MSKLKLSSRPLLDPVEGEEYHIDVLYRVSRKAQLSNGSIARQKERCGNAVEELRRLHPSCTFHLHESMMPEVGRHDLIHRRQHTCKLLEHAKRPNTYLMVADGNKRRRQSDDVARLTRVSGELRALLDQGVKVITASNPQCSPSSLVKQARKCERDYKRNQRAKQKAAAQNMREADQKDITEAQLAARRLGGAARREQARKLWKPMLGVVRKAWQEAGNPTATARLLNERGIKTPWGNAFSQKVVRSLHVAGLLERKPSRLILRPSKRAT